MDSVMVFRVCLGLFRLYGVSDVYVDSRRIAARGVVSLSSESKLLGSGTFNDVYTVS